MLEAIFLLAVNIYYEADVKDTLICREHIAQVVIQRSMQTRTKIKRVIFKKAQFSWTKHALDETGNLKPHWIPPTKSQRWRDSVLAAKQVYYRMSTTTYVQADHFYADYIKPPYWWKDIKPDSIFKCGKHWFGETTKKRKPYVRKMA